MIVKHDFFVHKKWPGFPEDADPISDQEQNSQITYLKERAAYEIGRMVNERTGFVCEDEVHRRIYSTKAVVFTFDEWNSFCNRLRAGLYNLAAPGLVDDLIKQLESK